MIMFNGWPRNTMPFSLLSNKKIKEFACVTWSLLVLFFGHVNVLLLS